MIQRTPEWFASKLGNFGASEAQTIAANGKGLETLVFEKATEILTGKHKEGFSNADTERGNELESDARNYYEIETGNVVTETGFIKIEDHVGCSPDGLIGEDGLVEIKCPSGSTFTRYLYDKKVDPKYMWQMQMQMWVTGRKWCDYVVYHPDFPVVAIIKRIDRDEAMIEKIKVGIESGKKQLTEILEKING